MTATPNLPIPWEGLFLSPVPPWGVSVVVRRPGADGRVQVLIVQRDRRGGQRWMPPSATRLPGEDVAACARRALEECAGLVLPVASAGDLQPGWAMYAARAGESVEPSLGSGYVGFAWVDPEEACRRCATGSIDAFALVA